MPSLPDRPKAITPEIQQLIIEYVAAGNYYEVACRAAGTTRQAVDWWRKLVDAGVEHAMVYADFFAALARANAIAEVRAVSRVSEGGRDWQGPAWFVERRFRKRWGRDKEPEPTAKPGVIDKAKAKADDRKRTRKPH